jgi:hypothetical protein
MEITNETPSEYRGWLAAAASIPGRSHIRAGIPCQDATAAGVSPRPYLIVCDGRGSANHSDIGANAAVEAIVAQLDNAAELFGEVLDADDDDEAESHLSRLARLIYRTAAQEQRRQASQLGTSPESFEHTLLVVVCGSKRFLYIQVGDGGIVMQRTDGSLQVLSEPARGEFANTTFFVTCCRPTTWRHRLVQMDGISGFMAFSDGTAEKLITAVDNTAASAVRQILGQTALGRFGREEILRFLTEKHWEPQIQDDRSLAILVGGSSTAFDTESASTPDVVSMVTSLSQEVYGDSIGAAVAGHGVMGSWRRHREIIAIVSLMVWIQLAFLAAVIMLFQKVYLARSEVAGKETMATPPAAEVQSVNHSIQEPTVTPAPDPQTTESSVQK